MKGRADIDIDGNRVRFEGHSLEVRHLGQLRSGYLSDNESLFLYLPREKFRGLEYLLDRLTEADNAALIHPLLGCYLAALGRVLPTLRLQDVASVAEATEAMIRASISYAPEMVDAGKLPAMMTRLELAKNYIDENLKSPFLNSNSVASFLSVSRRQLYKLFEAHGGVHSYIRLRRLEACFQAIVASKPNCPIARIAEDFGFTDMARFSRSFRAHFECSPSEVREQATLAPGPTAYERWLTTPPSQYDSPPAGIRQRPLLSAFR